SDGPKVKIESYAVKGRSVHVRGFFEGRTLKSAGIYDGDQLLRAIKVDDVLGEQRVNFDIELEEVTPGVVLRVSDAAGLGAEASLASAMAIRGIGGAKEVELGPPSESPNVSLGGGIASTESATVSHDVEEIPSRDEPPPASSPSQRHLPGHLADHLGNIQVNILNVSLEDPASRTYEVMGEVSGDGIRRAGIYVDGKLVKSLDIDTTGGINTDTFDESFQMNGAQATIRVYGPHDEYVESSIRVGPSSLPPSIVMPGMGLNPNQLAVQISSLRPIAANAVVVSGVVSGKNLASAGLYQNGMLMQQLPVSAGLLSALTSGSYRQVNFTAQFNPGAGPALVRVYDTGGQFAQQPVMSGGIGPYASPYGAPPYGYAQPPPKTPWWQQLLR
ncbi:MAG: hypothetical protein WA005_18835, partial [Candidatus Binataceae bacterium]